MLAEESNMHQSLAAKFYHPLEDASAHQDWVTKDLNFSDQIFLMSGNSVSVQSVPNNNYCL